MIGVGADPIFQLVSRNILSG
ncbi:hypothetical protein PIIN_10743 [Serendipita indica DSM 11827]|uniref:Uncharacterized protein n=1 Tax=Serendipita indica (strain DSM 11827) TaxID=1109443 RepID=G4TZL2_SERID|nr:hypothetical protein PIIN_10743 [Serendipita indica DSM 11827]